MQVSSGAPRGPFFHRRRERGLVTGLVLTVLLATAVGIWVASSGFNSREVVALKEQASRAELQAVFRAYETALVRVFERGGVLVSGSNATALSLRQVPASEALNEANRAAPGRHVLRASALKPSERAQAPSQGVGALPGGREAVALLLGPLKGRPCEDDALAQAWPTGAAMKAGFEAGSPLTLGSQRFGCVKATDDSQFAYWVVGS